MMHGILALRHGGCAPHRRWITTSPPSGSLDRRCYWPQARLQLRQKVADPADRHGKLYCKGQDKEK